MLFANPQRKYHRNPWINIAEMLGVSTDQTKMWPQSRGEFVQVIGDISIQLRIGNAMERNNQQVKGNT